MLQSSRRHPPAVILTQPLSFLIKSMLKIHTYIHTYKHTCERYYVLIHIVHILHKLRSKPQSHTYIHHTVRTNIPCAIFWLVITLIHIYTIRYPPSQLWTNTHTHNPSVFHHASTFPHSPPGAPSAGHVQSLLGRHSESHHHHCVVPLWSCTGRTRWMPRRSWTTPATHRPQTETQS